MKNSASVFASVVWIYLAISVSTVHAQATLTAIRTKAHINAPVNVGDIDGAFTEATNAFRHDRGTSDQYCPLTLARSDNVGSTSVTDGEINNASELSAILNESSNQAYLIVVAAIRYCNAAIQNLDACVASAASPILMANWILAPGVSWPFNARGTLLAHMYGRVLGLSFTTISTLEIMEYDTGIFSSDEGVRICSHCTSFRANWGTSLSYLWSLTDAAQTCQNQASIRGASRASGTCSDAVLATDHKRGRFSPALRQRDAEETPRRSIVDYATNVAWVQTPTNLHESYSQADANQLRALLKDDALIAKHPRISTILGLVSTGVTEDVEALAEYFQRPGADVAAAGMGLGYIAARVDSQVALDFLLTQHGSSDYRSAEGALYGLALSGRPEALRFIRERRLERAESEPKKRANVKAFYDDVEKANLTIAARGLKGYYGD